MTEIDTYEDYHGPATPKGFCPLCLSPERRGGMRAGNHIPYECGTSAVASGMRKLENGYYLAYHRNPYQISIGDDCFRNVARARDYYDEMVGRND